MDCNKKITTAQTLPTKCGEIVKPMYGLVPPVVTEIAPTDDTGVMHCQWNVRESVRTTEMLMPSNYLEIPELRLPRVFLHLAEEARNVKVENDLSCCSEEVQPKGTGLPSPVLVTVMMDSQSIPNKRVLRTNGASTEVMTNIKYIGRCKPIDRVDWVVLPAMTEQPVWLGLDTDERGNASADTGGPDVISDKQNGPVDRSGPEGPRSTTEQPALLGQKTNEKENAPVGPVGLDMNSTGHVPTSLVDPEVLWHRNQSFTDGPVGQDGTRRPVGTEWMHAESDADRPMAGGPVAQLFNSDPLCPSGMPFLDELDQPLAVGPVGQPFITGPLGKHASEPDCRQTNRIHSGPGGSTGVLHAANQTGSDVQTDHLGMGTTDGPASSGSAPPSSDSGVHSWKEQWENMSENLTDGASG